MLFDVEYLCAAEFSIAYIVRSFVPEKAFAPTFVAFMRLTSRSDVQLSKAKLLTEFITELEEDMQWLRL